MLYMHVFLQAIHTQSGERRKKKRKEAIKKWDQLISVAMAGRGTSLKYC